MAEKVTEIVTPKNCCLYYCGKIFDRASGINNEHVPEPGQFTLCIRCGCLMVFDFDLRVRGLTKEELETVKSNPAILEVIANAMQAIRVVNARMNQN